MPSQKRHSLPLHEQEEEEEEEDDDDLDKEQLLFIHQPGKICSHQPRTESELVEEDDDDDDESEVKHRADEDNEEEVKAKDSEESPSSSSHPKPEFIFVELPEIRKDLQCPICLGIIKKTRTVMECLHRFCRECIDKSMRMGNNECPACRTHCASRRSLRDDPNYDALIATVYPDIEKYEEEELAFYEEDQTINKQIQASIAQVLQRQSEALIKRRTPGKDTQDTYMTRTQRNSRSSYLRRRCSRTSEVQGSGDNEDGNDNNLCRDESSNDEGRMEVIPRRRKRRAGARSSQPSLSVANSDGGIENGLEGCQENRGISSGIAWNSEILAWGRGGARSHTRHGNAGGWSSRNTRLSKLVDYLRNLEENNDELDVHLLLISVDKHSTPTLQQPHLCCRPSLSVKYLCEYVSRHTPLKAEEIELFTLKGQGLSKDEITSLTCSKSTMDLVLLGIDTGKDELQVLRAEETLAMVKANCISTRGNLILLYRQKGGN